MPFIKLGGVHKSWTFFVVYLVLTSLPIFKDSVLFSIHPSNYTETTTMADLLALKKSLDEFSFVLFHTITNQPDVANKNIFLSPLSISSALLLVYLGAKDTTKKEIEASLRLDKHFGEKRENVLASYEEVLRVFVPGKDKDGQPAFNLALANKAYVQAGLALKPDYVKEITGSLKSEIGQVNFVANSEGARNEINQWVENQTNNKIKNLLVPGTITASTLMVLVNAIYFKADWSNKFDEDQTEKATFHNLNGKDVQVDMMAKPTPTKYQYYDNFEAKSDTKAGKLPPFQMLAIPYKQRELSMLIFLPRDKTGLKDFEKAVNVEAMLDIHENAYSRKAMVWLPRFKLEESYDLVEILEKVGVKQLFGSANLSGISDTPLTVTGAVHKAFVEVNEKGTEAAAATAMMMTRCMPMEDLEPPVEFRADRPFLFAIRHEETGLIAFLGRLGQL